MFTIMLFLIYFALTSLLHIWLDDKSDVIKRKGKWFFNKNFEDGEIIEIPSECVIDVNNETNFVEFEKRLREDIYRAFDCSNSIKSISESMQEAVSSYIKNAPVKIND